MRLSKLLACTTLVLFAAGSAYAMTDNITDNIRLAFGGYHAAHQSAGSATVKASALNVNVGNKIEDAAQITLVPESNAAAMVLGGLGLMGYVAFRRARNSRLFIGKF